MGSTMSTLKQLGFFSLACLHLFCVSKLAEPGSSLFSWHPVLMSVAFGLIIPEAFTQVSRFSEFGKRFSPRSRVALHWVLQACALTMAGVGSYCIFLNKVQNNRPHLKSLHSVFGVSTFIYAILQSVGGILLMYPSWKPSWAPGALEMKTYHTVSAACLMLGASATLFLANYSVWFAKHKLNSSPFATAMWIYPAVLAGRAVYTVYETGAFGRLCKRTRKAPLADARDNSL